MATTTNTLTAAITLSGVTLDLQNSYTVASTTDAYIRRMVITTTETQILRTNATVGAGMLESIKNLVIHNLSTKNAIRIKLTEAGSNQTAIFRIPPQRFMTFGSQSFSVNNTGGAFAAFVSFSNIYATAEYDTAEILFTAQHD